MQVPVNRYTVSLAIALIAFFGPDFLDPILKVIGILAAPHVPAM